MKKNQHVMKLAHVEIVRMRKAHPFFTKTIGIVFFLCAFCLMLSLSVIFNVNNLNFYKKQFQKLDLKTELKMSEKDYLNATEDLLLFVKGKHNSITAKATIDGEYRAVFNEKEITHMQDVKTLYQGLKTVMVWFLIVMFATMLLVYVKDWRNSYYILLSSYRSAILILGTIILMLVISIFVDFSNFWTMFHKLFFKNDLWLLNPNTDFMILMFPEQLFYALIMSIIGWFLLELVFLGLFIKIVKKKLFEFSH